MPPYSPPDSVEAGQRRHFWGAVGIFVVAIAVANLPSGAQETVASSLRATLLRPFLGLQSAVVGARARATEVGLLQARLDSATARLVALSTLTEENRRLRGILDLQGRVGPEWQAAQVLRPGTQGSESMFLLDRGSREGLEQWAPVMAREGLAGMVREVRPGSAVGMDWTHPDFRAGAMNEDGTVYGFVQARRGIFREQDRLLLTGTPFSTRLDSGNVVLTSGVGGVFPRGIPIGRVVALAEAEGGWRTSYWLEPYVQPGDLVHVLVARRAAPDDRRAVAVDPTTGRDASALGDTIAPANGDLTGAWPPELRGTRLELESRTRQMLDSLAALEERVRLLSDSLAARGGGGDAGDAAGGGGVSP